MFVLISSGNRRDLISATKFRPPKLLAELHDSLTWQLFSPQKFRPGSLCTIVACPAFADSSYSNPFSSIAGHVWVGQFRFRANSKIPHLCVGLSQCFVQKLRQKWKRRPKSWSRWHPWIANSRQGADQQISMTLLDEWETICLNTRNLIIVALFKSYVHDDMLVVCWSTPE